MDVHLKLVTERCEKWEKGFHNIAEHGPKAVVAAVALGGILGALFAWQTYRNQILPTVYGALIGIGATGIVSGFAYLVFKVSAKKSVAKWRRLCEEYSQLAELHKTIHTKNQIMTTLSVMLKAVKHDLRLGSEDVITQCKLY